MHGGPPCPRGVADVVVMAKLALVVDDSRLIRTMVASTLKESGFEVLQGGNGVEGLARLTGQHVDLIITDINMPVMDGLDFCQQVRALPAYKFTPLLILTTESDETKKQQGKGVGATGWLIKPFNPQQLVKVIGQVVK